MAIFYNYIKGCGELAQVGSGLTTSTQNPRTTNNMWTFIKWAKELKYYKKETSKTDYRYAENNPTIYLEENGTLPSESSYLTTGRILTSEARGQEIWYDISFKNGGSTGSSHPSSPVSSKFQQDSSSLCLYTGDFHIKNTSSGNPTIARFFGGSTKKIEFESSYPVTVKGKLTTNDQLKVTANGADITGDLDVSANSRLDGTVTVGGTFTVTSKLCTADSSGNMWIDAGSSKRLEVKNTTYLGYTSTSSYTAYFPDESVSADVSIKKNTTISGYCKATYFNAVSDARAKYNIQKVSFSATELVRKTPIYSFKYKNTNQPSIGVITQDVCNYEIDGFKLVDNVNASGENDDFMSIKESKLIYVLWKAIQEQQEEINSLKKMLRGDN